MLLAVVYISHREVDDFKPGQRLRIAKGRLTQLLATGVVLAIAAAMAITSMLAARLCMHALRGRRERQDWAELVTRNRELDRQLTSIWEGR